MSSSAILPLYTCCGSGRICPTKRDATHLSNVNVLVSLSLSLECCILMLQFNCDLRLLSRYSYSLRAGQSEDQIPVGVGFSAAVQTDPGAHPVFCTVGIQSFPGLMRPGRCVNYSPPSSAEVKETVELYLCSPSGPSWPVLGRTLLCLCTVCPCDLYPPRISGWNLGSF